MSDDRGARRVDPLDPAFIARDIWIPAWLRPRERLAAWSGGHRDGRFDVLGTSDADRVLTVRGSEEPGVDTFWLARTRATFGQADHRSRLEMEARVAKPRQELARLVRDYSTLSTRTTQLTATIAELSARTRPDANSVVAGPAEKNAAIAVIVARRMRTWEAPLAAAQAELASIEARLVSMADRAAELYGIVTVAFAAAVSRSNAIRSYYERRCDVYRRALTHSSPNGALIQAAGGSTLAIPVPDWTTSACPWVPDDYTAITKEHGNVQ